MYVPMPSLAVLLDHQRKCKTEQVLTDFTGYSLARMNQMLVHNTTNCRCLIKRLPLALLPLDCSLLFAGAITILSVWRRQCYALGFLAAAGWQVCSCFHKKPVTSAPRGGS